MTKLQITVHGIPACDAAPWWPRVSHWCEAALAHGGGLLNLDDVKHAVAERDMQLWVIHEGRELKAVCVTEIHAWPRAKVLTAVICGGVDMPHWIAALDDVLMRFGIENGCRVVDVHGRKGWKKTLTALGWCEANVTYAKELNHE